MLFGSCHLLIFVSSTNYFQMVRRQCCLVLDILTPFSSSWTRVQIIRAVSEHGSAINTKRSFPPCHSRNKVWGKYKYKYKFKYLASLSTLPLCSRTSHTQATWRSIITHIFKNTLQIQIQKNTNAQIHKYTKTCSCVKPKLVREEVMEVGGEGRELVGSDNCNNCKH